MSRFICRSIHHEFTGNLSRIHKNFQKSLWRIFHFYFVNWLQNWWKIFHKQVSAKLMVDFQKILGKLSIYFVVNFQEKIPWIFCEKCCSIYNSILAMQTKLTVTTLGSWQRIRATDHLFRGNLKRSLKPPLRLPPSHGYNADLAWPPSPLQWICLRTIVILSNWLSCIFLLLILTITGWPTAKLTISLSVKETNHSLVTNPFLIDAICRCLSLPTIALIIPQRSLSFPTIHYWVVP